MNRLLIDIPEYANAESIGQEWVELDAVYSRKIGGIILSQIAGLKEQEMPKETFFVLSESKLLIVAEFEKETHYIEIPKLMWRFKRQWD